MKSSSRRLRRKSDLRLYHFGATLLVVGIGLWVAYIVGSIAIITEENLRDDKCNQALVRLFMFGSTPPESLTPYCNDEIMRQVEEYQNEQRGRIN